MYTRRLYTWSLGFFRLLVCSLTLGDTVQMLLVSEWKTVVGFRIETDKYSSHSWKDTVQLWDQGSSFLCTLGICVVPGKVPWPVTEFHEHSLSVVLSHH